jgi:hypothetical protein
MYVKLALEKLLLWVKSSKNVVIFIFDLYDAINDECFSWDVVYIIRGELNEFIFDTASLYDCLFKYFEFVLLIYDYLFAIHFE